MTLLENYGWNLYPFDYKNHSKDNLKPARVVSIKGFRYEIVAESGIVEAELSGRLLYGTESEDLPKVGDWILFMDYDTMGYVVETLPRINELSRKSPGTKTERQVLAANVDAALIVQGLDRDFNVMRLERYLVQLAACRIKPVVVLNKADLIDNPDDYLKEVQKLQRDCEVFFCSTYTGSGIDRLKSEVMKKFRTYILIGSSGVGKSSLLNALISTTVQSIGDVSDSTSKGKHTTTTRDLFQLPNGSLVIDTPGMREFGVTLEEGQLSGEMFPAIQKFAGHCRFNDCKHIDEAGCAVLSALETGALDDAVYDSYIKLIKEQRRFEIKAEDKKRLNRQFGKLTKEAKNHRKKYKY